MKKVLLLGTHDSKMAGHIQHLYINMAEHVEAVIVTRFGFYGKAKHCYWPLGGEGLSFFEKIKYVKFSRSFFFLWRFVYSLFILGCFPKVDKKHPEYSFGDFEFLPYNANDILKKCPVGFVPDVIIILWSSRFISSKIIYDLYQRTKAKIVYSFVDEAPMTGGCHYPNGCKGYLDGCEKCPALSFGKKLATVQMKTRIHYLKNIPMYLIGSPYDMRLAKQTDIFKNSEVFPSVYYPNVIITPQNDARSKFGISEDKFVVLIGATSLANVRKGFVYAVDAINKASKTISNLLVLIIGNTKESLKPIFPDVEIVELGFVETEKMILAYCAADCFLSTTIADSGPQMVNYSIATGTPVVSFSIGIAEDLVIHKTTGYIAKFKDSDDVASGLLFLSELNEKSKETMSVNCIKRIQEASSHNCWEKHILGISL